jgi:hypothetical protein
LCDSSRNWSQVVTVKMFSQSLSEDST